MFVIKSSNLSLFFGTKTSFVVLGCYNFLVFFRKKKKRIFLGVKVKLFLKKLGYFII